MADAKSENETRLNYIIHPFADTVLNPFNP